MSKLNGCPSCGSGRAQIQFLSVIVKCQSTPDWVRERGPGAVDWNTYRCQCCGTEYWLCEAVAFHQRDGSRGVVANGLTLQEAGEGSVIASELDWRTTEGHELTPELAAAISRWFAPTFTKLQEDIRLLKAQTTPCPRRTITMQGGK